uniref:Fukutin-related protein-like n=1 Tax=Saccoglossus kowalevskii TaxID=10224 RepID=A0ABM0MHC2_SACKO|nr:PREDICTED: fukutin-related protein-like [Saccoglossus kowalevskii]
MAALIHFVFFPSINESYNDPCYLTTEQLDDLRYVIRNVLEIYEDMNVTYWLDFGTLLGAVRNGDIIRYDHDADISRIVPEGPKYSYGKFIRKLKEREISANATVANYKGMIVELHTWDLHEEEFDGKIQIVVKKWLSTWLKNMNSRLDDWHNMKLVFPLSWLLPTKRMQFVGVNAKIPHNTNAILLNRYALTYRLNVSFPYKWKCWIPYLN